MRSFLGSQGLANLSEQDIDDIIVFLRSNDPALEPDFSERMGEETYQRNCAACHQPGGQGLVGVAPSLSSPEFLALASDDLIRKTVRRGRLGTPMVPRHGITDWELEAIVEYLRSLSANGKSDLEVDYDLRIEGDAERGRQNFTTYCAPCHGPRGEGYAAGGSGPGIGLPSFLGAVADDYIFKTVKYGRTGTPMQPLRGTAGASSAGRGGCERHRRLPPQPLSFSLTIDHTPGRLTTCNDAISSRVPQRRQLWRRQLWLVWRQTRGGPFPQVTSMSWKAPRLRQICYQPARTAVLAAVPFCRHRMAGSPTLCRTRTTRPTKACSALRA